MAAAPVIAVVIPVYDQPARLAEVVTGCLRHVSRVWVVDDGSGRPVAPSLAGLPVTVWRHAVNRGKGQALRTAAARLSAAGCTHMITLDADGQHLPEDLPRLLEAVRRAPRALHLGVRDFHGSGAPLASRFGRAFGNFWVRLQTGHSPGDIQSGFRAYPLTLFASLPCFCRRYGFEVEMVVRALWGGVAVRRVPVRVRYAPAGQRVSHFHKLVDNLRLTLLNTHLTLRAVVPWPHPQVTEGAQPVTLRHPLRSLRRLLAESAAPRDLGWAVALGVLLGALPLVAVHTLTILVAAAWFRLNRVAAVAASQLCMPPVVPALCIEAGYFLRHGRFLTLAGARGLREASFLELGRLGVERLWDWLVGSLVVGPSLAVVLGLLTTLVATGLARARRD